MAGTQKQLPPSESQQQLVHGRSLVLGTPTWHGQVDNVRQPGNRLRQAGGGVRCCRQNLMWDTSSVEDCPDCTLRCKILGFEVDNAPPVPRAGSAGAGTTSNPIVVQSSKNVLEIGFSQQSMLLIFIIIEHYYLKGCTLKICYDINHKPWVSHTNPCWPPQHLFKVYILRTGFGGKRQQCVPPDGDGGGWGIEPKPPKVDR